jgi:hypothetical protein
MSRHSGRSRPRRLWLGAAGCLLFAAPAVAGPTSALPAAASGRLEMGSVSCGGSSSGAGTEEPTGPPIAKIRVANFYLNVNGTPGATLDFYDAPRPAKKDKPLISGLKYGQISGYVSPRESGPLSSYANLYIFQHGCRTAGGHVDGMESGENISNAGWLKGQQETIVLDDGFDGLAAAPSLTTLMEVEPKGDGYSQIIKPSGGTGMLVLDSAGLVNGVGKIGSAYVRVDGNCPDNPIVAGQTPAKTHYTDPTSLGNAAAFNFPQPLGSRKLEVVASASGGVGLTESECNKSPALASTTVKISGGPTLLFLYGRDPQHTKFLVTKVG